VKNDEGKGGVLPFDYKPVENAGLPRGEYEPKRSRKGKSLKWSGKWPREKRGKGWASRGDRRDARPR